MNPIFENLTLEIIEKNFGPELFRQAMYLYDSNAVIDLGFDDHEQTIMGMVADHGKEHPCQVKFTEDRILIGCDCSKIKEGTACQHVVALLVVWVNDRDLLLAEKVTTADFNLMAGRPEPYTEWAARPAASSAFSPEKAVQDYRQKLGYFTVGSLRDLAARRGIKISGQRREGILDALAAGLARPDNLAAAVGKLSRGARLALDLLLVIQDDLELVYLKSVYHWLEGALAEIETHVRVDALVDELVQSGLAFSLDGRVRLPMALSALPEQNPHLVKVYTGAFTQVDEAPSSELSRLALWLLLLSQAGALECSPPPHSLEPGGWLPGAAPGLENSRLSVKENRERTVQPLPPYLKPETLRRLTPVIGHPGEKIDYTARLVGAAGLWEQNNPRKLTGGFTHWLQLDPHEQGQLLFETALSLEAPVELDLARAAGNLVVRRDTMMHLGYKSFQQSLVHARRLFVNLLRRLPGDVWIEVDTLMRLVHGLAPDFLRENNNPRLVWLEVNGVPVKSSSFDEWLASYGFYYEALLTGPLLWMGACRVAWQAGRPVAVSLTRQGEALLGNVAHLDVHPAPSERPSLVFGKDALLELSPADAEPQVISLVLLLSRMQPVRQPAGQHSGAPVLRRLAYQVTYEGIGRAFEAGWTLERLQEVLGKAATAPLPPGLLDLFQRCWDRYGRLHIYDNMALIQFGDDYCLPELLTGTHLGQHMLYQFNPRLIAVRPGSVQEILKELRAKGYTPRTVEGVHDG
jgi:hypothetical protein